MNDYRVRHGGNPSQDMWDFSWSAKLDAAAFHTSWFQGLPNGRLGHRNCLQRIDGSLARKVSCWRRSRAHVREGLTLAGELPEHKLRNVTKVPVVFRDLLTQVHCLNSSWSRSRQHRFVTSNRERLDHAFHHSIWIRAGTDHRVYFLMDRA
jgi:hypothetical protein